MLTNAFLNQSEAPGNAELAAALGSAKAVWDRLLNEFENDCNLTTQEWKSYSRKAGWSLRLKRKDRNILYLSPSKDAFMVSFALGGKAVAAARKCGLPPAIVKVIDDAKKYAEGTAVRLDVTSMNDIPAIRKLVEIKIAN